MDEPEVESRGEDTSKTPESFDLLRYQYGSDPYWPVPAGDGQRVVDFHESDARQRRLLGSLTAGLLPVSTAFVVGFFYLRRIWLLLVGAGFVVGGLVSVGRHLYEDHHHRVPEIVAEGASSRVVSSYVDDFDPSEVDPDDVSTLVE